MKLLWESQHILKMSCLCGRSDIERSTRENFSESLFHIVFAAI